MSLTVLAAGCGSKEKEPAAGGKGKSVESKKAASRPPGGSAKAAPKAARKAAQKAARKAAPKAPAKAAEATAGGGHILLTDRGCVEFEPHWSTIRVGQSLTWQSKLKKPITIHVPAGAFDRAEFVVKAGGTVGTGPAREPGEHAMWSLPGACQAAPHGVQGAGPGVSVEPGGS